MPWKSTTNYIFWSLSYPACNAHAPYCHLWPVRFYDIFPHYFLIGTIFEKKGLLNTKCVFWFYLQILSKTFLILRRTERDMIKNVYWSSWKYPVFLWDFNKIYIFCMNFLYILKYQISQKSIQSEESWSMRTDKHTWIS
jgi:hypothetical protein